MLSKALFELCGDSSRRVGKAHRAQLQRDEPSTQARAVVSGLVALVVELAAGAAGDGERRLEALTEAQRMHARKRLERQRRWGRGREEACGAGGGGRAVVKALGRGAGGGG